MKSFYEFSEMINENQELDQQLDEKFGQMAGKLLDRGVSKAGQIAGRAGNAITRGVGRGIVQGAKRGYEVAKQGNDANQLQQARDQMTKALNSYAKTGDINSFKKTTMEIIALMKPTQRIAGNITPEPKKRPIGFVNTMADAGLTPIRGA